jgi:alpha-2-macroglobulin
MKYFIILLFIIQFGINAQSNFQVESFSPEGIVKNPTQVSVRFSEDIVAFGDSREQGSVFESNCSELGTSRWLDSKNWVFDFIKPLESGNLCKFTISKNLVSMSGGKISGKSMFQFSTGGVNIEYSSPWSSSTIVEDQIIMLKLDGLVNEKSAIEKSYFVSDGSADKIYVKQVSGRQLDELLQAAYWTNLDRERILVIAPKTEFPAETKLNFVWPKEIESKSGIKNDKDQKLNFKVRPKFQASFYCERENAQKHCIPFSSMEVRFSFCNRAKICKWNLFARFQG